MPELNHNKEQYDMDERRVWEKVLHTDARVTAMEGQMQDMTSSMHRIESLLLNRQTPTTAIIGITLTALTLLAGLLFGMAQFTSVALQPVADDVAEHRISINDIQDFKEDMQYKLGALEEWQSNISQSSTSCSRSH